MWPRPKTRTLVVAALLGGMLGGCTDIYLDRRDTVTLASGEAMAANRVTHMIDPWPKASGNRDIAYDGEKAAAASERYRTGRVIQPRQGSASPSPIAPQSTAGGGGDPAK
jgi:surface antigen